MNTPIDRAGRSALHYAALENNVPEVRRLLEEGFDSRAVDKSGWTPLHFAAQEYSIDAAALLLQHCASVDAQNCHGNTPLSNAVFYSRGRGELIQLLRKNGADPHLSNKSGVSPLSLARTITNFDVGQYFDDIPE
jgi:ankyrin repeat protein